LIDVFEAFVTDPLDTKAAYKTTLPLLDLSSIFYPQLEPSGKLQDNSMSAHIEDVEDACEFDADEQEVFHYQPPNSGSDGDGTFDYNGVDCTPEAPRTAPAPATEDQALPSPYLTPPLGSREHSLDRAPSSSPAKKTTSEVIARSDLSPRFSLPPDVTTKWAVAERAVRYASDDIQVGIKGQSGDEIISITRCASVDNFSSTFETTSAHGSYFGCIWLYTILT
jgi:hypothetical protein